MTDGKDHQPTIATFLDLLEHQLQERDYDTLLEVLRVVAEHISPEQRYDVLVAINELSTATSHDLEMPSYPEIPLDSPSRELIEGAENLAQRLENGDFYTGWGWDEERQEERAWGNELWAHEMDELFGRAATMYLSEGFGSALRVYGPLLNTFKHAGRIGVFCGPLAPSQMIQSDLDEAKRRFLRCAYLVTPPAERPQRLLLEMEALRQVGDEEVALESLANGGFQGDPTLTELDEFLPAWIDLLKEVTRSQKGWGREARRLLREAVEMQGGVDGMGELARQEGRDHPEAFHEWVGLLVRQERTVEAIAAAREGVAEIADPAYKARMADRLGLLAHRLQDRELALEAAREAWRALPTETRLLTLAKAADAVEMLSSVMGMEARRVIDGEWNHSQALACRLLLLATRHDEAIECFQNADIGGWGRPDNAGAIVFPYLLLVATNCWYTLKGTVLWNLWTEMDAPETGYFDRRLLLDQLSGNHDSTTADERPYTDFLATVVDANKASDDERAEMLTMAKKKAKQVAQEFLKSQHRRGQSLCAELTVAIAETIAVIQAPGEAIEYALSLEQELQQYGYFGEELRTLLSHSPILSHFVPEGGKEGPTLVLVK